MAYQTLDDFIRDVPIHAARHAEQLKGTDALFLLRTKQGRELFIRVQNGEVTTAETMDGTPMCTVIADEDTLLELIAGRMNPVKAIMLRRIVVQGNPAPLMKLLSAM